ncbi:hypothetical protein [Streptomyces sp. NPDC005407]
MIISSQVLEARHAEIAVAQRRTGVGRELVEEGKMSAMLGMCPRVR